MSQWYVNIDGLAQGPLSQEDLVEKVLQGEINSLDLVFRVGSSEWLPLSEVGDLVDAVDSQREEQRRAEETARAEEAARARAIEEKAAREKELLLKAEQERAAAELVKQQQEQAEREKAEKEKAIKAQEIRGPATGQVGGSDAVAKAHQSGTDPSGGSSSTPVWPTDGLEATAVQKPEWILLKKVVVNGKKQFKQIGPYTQWQVMQMLEKGKVQFQDHAWKSGLSDWKRVGEIEDFKVDLPSSPPLETVIYDQEAFRALENKLDEKNPWETTTSQQVGNENGMNPGQACKNTTHGAQGSGGNLGNYQAGEGRASYGGGPHSTQGDASPTESFLENDGDEATEVIAQPQPGSSSEDAEMERTFADLIEVERFEREKTKVISAAELRKQWSGSSEEVAQESRPQEENWSIAPGQNLSSNGSSKVYGGQVSDRKGHGGTAQGAAPENSQGKVQGRTQDATAAGAAGSAITDPSVSNNPSRSTTVPGRGISSDSSHTVEIAGTGAVKVKTQSQVGGSEMTATRGSGVSVEESGWLGKVSAALFKTIKGVRGEGLSGPGFEGESWGGDEETMGTTGTLGSKVKPLAIACVFVLSLGFFVQSLFSGGSETPIAGDSTDPAAEDSLDAGPSAETAEEKLAAYQEKKEFERLQLEKEIARLKAENKAASKTVAKNQNQLKASSSEKSKASNRDGKKSSVAKSSSTKKTAKASSSGKVAKKSSSSKKSKASASTQYSSTSRADDGTLRSRSFYLHRDRLNLFYSSQVAETQVASLEENFKKLKRKPAQWGRFYKAWKKELRTGVPKIIRSYPQKGVTYGHPKSVSSFSEDYKSLLVYGELHNAKVTGARLPASPGKRFDKLFSEHKMSAQNLSFR